MKRNAGLAGILLLGLVCVMGSVTGAKTLTAAEKANIRYAQYLKSHETEGKSGYVQQFAAVQLDDNAVPDLFEMTDGVAAVSFLNGKAYKGTVRTWADMKVVYYLYPKAGVFSYSVYDSDGSTRPEFLYRKLTVRTNGKKDVYVAGLVRNDNDEEKYYSSAKENTAAQISKADYNKLIKKAAGAAAAKKLVFYENTKANRKKYLGDTGDVAEITLDTAKKTLALKGTAQLKATVKNADSSVITWESNNPKVVQVEPDEDGQATATVRALKGGVATVTASVSGVSASCKITVDAPSIELDSTSATVFVKKTLKLKATVTGPAKSVSWKSSNEKVASVSGGVVTGKKAGTAKITATANGLSAVCTVKVQSMEENVKKLTAVKAGKSYVIKFDAAKDAVSVARKGNKLLIDDKAVLTLKSASPAYELYLTDLDTTDKTKEVVEFCRDSAGKSSVTVYRYADGKLTKAASLAGKKGASVQGGFAYKKGQAVKTPGDGTIVLQQELVLGGSEKVKAQMVYEVSGKTIRVMEYDEDDDTAMTCKSAKNRLKKSMDLLDDVEGDPVGGKIAKNASYKPMKFAISGSKAYLKVKVNGKKGWLSFALSSVKYQ